jgi:transposase
MASPFTLTNEQINSLPLLLGIIQDMGIRDFIDAQVIPHGHWQGISVGTLVSLWLCHLLIERDHRMVMVRDWAQERKESINALLGIDLRDTDCIDDRLTNVLSMLGEGSLQATLDTEMVSRWVRVYALPTQTVRLDSTSISVYHDPAEPDSLLQMGHSKDHRPDLRQFKAMLASLDRLGMPLVCQPVAGNRADDGLYIPSYEASVAVLGRRDLLVVGDSKMGALATRAHIATSGSCYLCAYRPPGATAEITGWIEAALEREERWQTVQSVEPTTGQVTQEAVIDEWERPQRWSDPVSGREHTWTERVLLVRSCAYQQGLLRRREQALERVTDALLALQKPPGRGRKSYRSQEELEAVVSGLIARAGLGGVLHAPVIEQVRANGTGYFVVERVFVERVAWQRMAARLGWQVYLSNTTKEQYAAVALVESYRGQAIQERGFSRLKSRNLQIRPVFVREEQRICGLVWLLCLALRVLTLTEYRLRCALSERKEELVGLNPASRAQASARPTTERVIAAFGNLTLTILEAEGVEHRHVTALNATQQHILALLNLPADLYARLATTPLNSLQHLRE